ncbi:MAG TPA: hypothetical protein VGM76_08420 [Lacipirellulaceae bacterium]|jgi:hypothetical protein
MNIKPDNDPKLSPARQDLQRSVSASSSSGSLGNRGQAYSPPPGAAQQPANPTPPSTSPWRTVGLALIIVAALGASAWYGISTRPAPAHVPAAAAAAHQTKSFAVSAKDLDSSATERLKSLFSSGGVASASAVDALKAVNASALCKLAETSPQIADDIKSGRRELYRVNLLDFLAEDGDHVEFFADGLGYGDIDLKNAGKSLLIPLLPGKITQIKVVATADGGGGVTVGFVSSLNEARTDILQVGQSEEWQVIVQ